MRSLRRASTLAVITVSLLASVDARAEVTEEKAEAQGLFDIGKKLMLEGKFEEACPKLADSLRIDPAIGTMLFLADCYESVGRTASAWAEFREAQAVAARQMDLRERVARDRANALEGRLTKLVIIVSSPAAADLRVKRDGLDVGEALWGAAIAVDPGVHAISVSAPNKKDWTTSVTMGLAGSPSSVTVPLLEDALVASAPVNPAPAPAYTLPPEPRNAGQTQRLLGISLASVGVLGIGIGTVTGLLAKSKLDASNSGHCEKATNYCDAQGLGMRNTALTEATISTFTVGLGLAALVGGAALYFTAPKRDATVVSLLPSAGPQGGGLALHASF